MLPKGWSLVQLGSLLEAAPQNGYSPVCSEEPTGKWVLGLGTLGDDGIDLSQAKPAPIDDPLVDRFLLRPGDFLISRSNTLDRVGRIAVFRGGIDQYAYPDLMMRFRIEAARANPDYVEAYLRSERVSKYIQRHATGTSGSMKKINQGVVEGIPILLPPLTTQRDIAELLSTWTVAIEKTEQLIAAKERQFTWLLHTLIDVASARSQWRQVRLGEIAEIKKGKQLNVTDMIADGKYYALNGGIAPSGFTNQWNTPENTITISEGGNSCGFVNFNTEKFWCGGHCYALTDISNAENVKYLFHFLKSRQTDLMALRVGSGLPNIQKKDIDAFPVKIPPSAEQGRIASLLDTARSEITLLEKTVPKYREQKRGLMQKLLTGQWRLNIAEEMSA